MLAEKLREFSSTKWGRLLSYQILALILYAVSSSILQLLTSTVQMVILYAMGIIYLLLGVLLILKRDIKTNFPKVVPKSFFPGKKCSLLSRPNFGPSALRTSLRHSSWGHYATKCLANGALCFFVFGSPRPLV